MEEFYKEYERKIEKKAVFSFSPKYKEEFPSNISKNGFEVVINEVFTKLEWEIEFVDDSMAVANRKDSVFNDKTTEIIKVTREAGRIIVESESTGNEFYDFGRNSKRVKLFIFAFEHVLKNYSKEELNTKEKEIDKRNNMDDYIIPDSLPKPRELKTPQIAIPMVGGILTSIILGVIVAFVSVNLIYIIGLYEVGIAIALTYVLGQLIKMSNFSDYSKIKIIFIAMVINFFISNLILQYIFNTEKYELEGISFSNYIILLFESGLMINNINLGWIGLIISWLFQLLGIYFIGIIKLPNILLNYIIGKIPPEVVEFAYYHFIKGKNEDGVRKELAKMGWDNKENQDEVFEAIDGIYSVKEIIKMKS